VAKVKVPNYQVRRNGRGFWEPTAKMRSLGFCNVPCGKDGPDAWKVARQWQQRWEQTRKGQSPAPAMVTAENLSLDQIEEVTTYPPRSVGEGFRRFRRTEEWKSKAQRTREDWWRVFRRIKPVFGDCDPKTVTLEDLDAWRAMIEQTVSRREAHRCIKIWRALWGKLAALGYCVRDADPSLGLTNHAAEGRSATWTEGEVVRLVKRAWRERYYGLAATIATIWCAQQSPGDVRTLRASQLVTNGQAVFFVTNRAKTGVPIGGALNDRALAVVEAYVAELGVELHGEAPIFRNRSGAPYSKDTLGDDLRGIRVMEFGPDEDRTLADFRRSGTQEAFAGGAQPADVSHTMGNTIATSNMLFATYNPANATSVQKVHEARVKGRRKLREAGKVMRPLLDRKVEGGAS
jgi:hypothetical protein